MNRYFLYFNYGATGEGSTVTLGFVSAESKEAATRAFLIRGILKDSKPERLEEGYEYFSRGVVCTPTSPEGMKDALRIMKQYLAPSIAEGFCQAEEDNSLFDFFFHAYINYS